MLVDPAQFIVRRNTYEQFEGFPEACAELVKKLKDYSPKTFSHLYDFLTEQIQSSPVLNRDWRAVRRKGFGETRVEGDIHTDLEPKYAADSTELLHRYGKNAVVQLTHNGNDHGEKVALSKIVTGENGATIWFPAPDDEAFMGELRWSDISQSYLTAMNAGKDPKTRERASLQTYALLSHDCPCTRGSALFARVALEYLAHEVGFEVPFAKPDTDFNTKAAGRPPEQFIKEWESGDYFDRKATSEEIMDWHRSRIISVERAARS